MSSTQSHDSGLAATGSNCHSTHSVRRRRRRSESHDIKNGLESGAELEPYPDDPRGPSCLFVGRDQSGRWLHVLCGNFDRAQLLVTTVYEPRPPKWQDAWARSVRR